MVSTGPLISKSSSSFINLPRIVLNTTITISISVTFIFKIIIIIIIIIIPSEFSRHR